jgi:osmotically-inducible protein OsmY
MTDLSAARQQSTAIDIARRAEERLRQSPYFYLRNLLCSFEAGVLTITGKVPYWQLRNFAESIVSRIDGVQHVANHVQVVDPQQPAIAPQALRTAG